MDTGIYIALSRELGIMRDMEVTSNNVANASSAGFQSQKLLFSDYLVPSTKSESNVAFANDVSTYLNTEQGALKITHNPLNAAIQGKGYFVIDTPLGERYTRNGSFVLNEQGELATSEGYTVLDESSQPVVFDELDQVIEIREDGTIVVDASERAKLRVVQFDNEQLVERAGSTMFRSDITPRPAENFRVVSGAVEQSNVQPFTALTHLMYLSRTVSDTNNLINSMYSLSRKASDTLAKVYA